MSLNKVNTDYKCVICDGTLDSIEGMYCFSCIYYIKYIKSKSIKKCVLCLQTKEMVFEICDECDSTLDHLDKNPCYFN